MGNPELMRKYDLDDDGRVTSTDINDAANLIELELREEKASTQKRMAWVAMISMLVFTIGLFMPFVPDSRVQALADLLGLFYIAQAGVVGAYMGVMAWMSSNVTARTSRLSAYELQRVRRTVDDEPTELTDRSQAE